MIELSITYHENQDSLWDAVVDSNHNIKVVKARHLTEARYLINELVKEELHSMSGSKKDYAISTETINYKMHYNCDHTYTE
jgi:hypothetical protein